MPSEAVRLPPRLRRPVVLVATLALLALVGGACSSSGSSSKSSADSDTSSSTAANGGSSAKPPACPSVSEVDGVLKAGLKAPKDQVNGNIRTCTYDGPPGGDDVVIRWETGVSAADFQAAETSPSASGATARPVTGIGDAAFDTSAAETGNVDHSLSALKGTTELSIKAPVELSQIETLAKQLLQNV